MTISAKRLLLTFLIGTLGPAQAAGDDHARVRYWLERMTRAVDQLNYQGTFVYRHGGNMEAMRILHVSEEGREVERLFSLNGEPREVVRDDEHVSCILPNDHAIATNKRRGHDPLSPLPVIDPANLTRYYDLHMMRPARVAGRMAQVIAIVPLDEYRYGFRLYLDDETALPLEWDMLNRNGQLVSQIMFTELSVGEQIQDTGSLMREEQPDAVTVTPTHIEETTQLSPGHWVFGDMPQGFRLRFHETSDHDREHFVFSDGLSSLSVYVQDSAQPILTGTARMGSVNAFGSYHDGHQLTAVGEVPLITLRQVVERMQARAEVAGD